MIGSNEYIAEVDYDGDMLLEDWQWLLQGKYSLWFVTKFGDVFLKAKAGSVAWLDVTSGSVSVVAASEQEFLELARGPDNLDRWFMRNVVDHQAAIGMSPARNQCISFVQPVVLGGKLESTNLELTDAAVHLSIAGQIHRQVKDLPPGTKISGVSFETPADTQKNPWWKLW